MQKIKTPTNRSTKINVKRYSLVGGFVNATQMATGATAVSKWKMHAPTNVTDRALLEGILSGHRESKKPANWTEMASAMAQRPRLRYFGSLPS